MVDIIDMEGTMTTLCIDVAGVLMNVPTRITSEEFDSLKDEPWLVKPTTCLSNVARSAQHFDKVFLISAAESPEVRSKTMEWLDHWDFWIGTGIPREHIYFTETDDEAKARLCASMDIFADVFIDDNPGYLNALKNFASLRLFYDRDEGEVAPKGCTVVTSWTEILEILEGKGL